MLGRNLTELAIRERTGVQVLMVRSHRTGESGRMLLRNAYRGRAKALGIDESSFPGRYGLGRLTRSGL